MKVARWCFCHPLPVAKGLLAENRLTADNNCLGGGGVIVDAPPPFYVPTILLGQ